MARPFTTPLTLLGPALVMTTAGTAAAATPTYYADQATFLGQLSASVTDDYSNPGYAGNQNDAPMSAVLGETDYSSTGFNNLNLVVNQDVDARYCAGCNGSFELSFQTTSVGNASGVDGVGFFVDAHGMAPDYYAFITFADGTTDNIPMPAAGSYWAVTAPERIERIHVGLTMGESTTDGYFELDDLTIGQTGPVPCEVDDDCVDNADPCTDAVCLAGICGVAFNEAPCDDDELCTEMDTCSMGVCGGTQIDCDDGNECTTDACEPGVGCFITLNTNPCDDQSVCTQMDTCSAGVCTGTMIDCADDDVCSMDSCDPQLGCINEPEIGCCLDEDDCGEREVCDVEMNVCMPTDGGTGDSGDSTDDSGDSGQPDDTGDTGDTGQPGDTGVDGGTGDGTGGSGTGDAETGAIPPDPGATTGSSGDTGAGADGDIPPPDFSVCNCTTDSTPPRHAWWLMVVLGLFTRRRGVRAASGRSA